MFGFPTFRAWRNALLLMIPAYGAATVVFLFAFWIFLITFCILLSQYDPVFLFFLGMALVWLFVGSIWYLLVNLLYSLLLRFLWDKPPSWLRPPRSFKQNLIHLGVATLATFPIAAIYIIHLLWISNLEILTEMDYKVIFASNLLLRLSWLWLIAAAYVYYCLYLLNEKKIVHKSK